MGVGKGSFGNFKILYTFLNFTISSSFWALFKCFCRLFFLLNKVSEASINILLADNLIQKLKC